LLFICGEGEQSESDNWLRTRISALRKGELAGSWRLSLRSTTSVKAIKGFPDCCIPSAIIVIHRYVIEKNREIEKWVMYNALALAAVAAPSSLRLTIVLLQRRTPPLAHDRRVASGPGRPVSSNTQTDISNETTHQKRPQGKKTTPAATPTASYFVFG